MGVATAIAIGGLAVSAASAVNSADNQRKALHAQQDAAKAAGDIGALNDITTDQSKQNALDSRALEEQLSPEVVALRQSANTNLLGAINQPQNGSVTRGQSLVEQNMGVPLNTPLLNAAIAKAQADLGLGGRLSTDAQNAATRGAAARAGQVGGGLDLGRDLTARDLGLTSANVEQQRLMNASQLGGQELNREQSNQSNLLNSLNTLRSINDTRFNQLLATAQYSNSIAPPLVGLDPGSAAGIRIAALNAQGAAGANAANVQGAQSNAYLNLAGQGLAAYQQYRQGSTAGIGAPTSYDQFILNNPNSSAAIGQR
jgi:hypothetical protein